MSLANDFVRSAVKQVGRDTGKIISNNLYGDAHATPVRTANNEGIDEAVAQVQSARWEYSNLSPQEQSEKAIELGYLPEVLSISGKFIIWYIIGFIFVPFIICFVALYRAYKYYTLKRIKYTGYFDKPTYVTDRRTRTGTRYAGDIRVRKSIYLPALNFEQEQAKTVAKKYLLMGIAPIIFIIILSITK